MPTEQKQWKVLKDYLEVFLIGVDPKLPTRVDVVFDEKANRTVWTIPVGNFQNFRKNNLAAILTPRIRDMGNGWWKLGSGKPADFNGWLNYTAPYSRIGETKDDINLTPADPAAAAAPLLARHFLLGGRCSEQADRRRRADQAARAVQGHPQADLGGAEERYGRIGGRFRSAQEGDRNRDGRAGVVLHRIGARARRRDDRHQERARPGRHRADADREYFAGAERLAVVHQAEPVCERRAKQAADPGLPNQSSAGRRSQEGGGCHVVAGA